jgi:hypothetical protein
VLAQISKTAKKDMTTASKKNDAVKKHKAKLPPQDLTMAMRAGAQYNFSPSGLRGAMLNNPTSLQFGPDNRLYVAEQGAD